MCCGCYFYFFPKSFTNKREKLTICCIHIVDFWTTLAAGARIRLIILYRSAQNRFFVNYDLPSRRYHVNEITTSVYAPLLPASAESVISFVRVSLDSLFKVNGKHVVGGQISIMKLYVSACILIVSN